MPKQIKSVMLKLDHIISDRNQYKPYIAQLSGENVYVEVFVENDKNDVTIEKGKTILTVNGLAAVLGEVATAIEEMHNNYRIEKFGV